MPQIPLTQNDILFAVAGGVILFAIYRLLSGIIRMFITRSREFSFDPEYISSVLENCYRIFPIERFNFKGATFERGVPVRITTVRKTTIEGKFIGTNQLEMLGLVTDSSIIAQEIKAIHEIQEL